SGFQMAMLLEHSSQIFAPIILLLFIYRSVENERIVFFAKVLIALTFIFHGFYALGIYPVPGKFIDMLISVFGVSEQTAKSLLFLAGTMDILICALIFFPRFQKPALIYAVAWGFITALAR